MVECEILRFETARPALGLNPVVVLVPIAALRIALRKTISAFKKFFARSNLTLVFILFQVF